MKLIQTTKVAFVFQLATREKHLLLDLLKVYPKVPSSHAQISKSPILPDRAITQRLLDEALAEQRAENKRQLQVFVSDARRWTEQAPHWLLSLSGTELEWLLQVLNDIRVGSWIILGSPEQWFEAVTPQTAPHLWAMELAGAFEMAFLHAVEGRNRPG